MKKILIGAIFALSLVALTVGVTANEAHADKNSTKSEKCNGDSKCSADKKSSKCADGKCGSGKCGGDK